MRSADDFDAFYAGSVLGITAQMYPIICSRAQTEHCVQEAYARAWQRWGRLSYRAYRRIDREAMIRIVALRVSMYGWQSLYGWNGRRSAVPQEDQPAVITALRQLQAADRQVLVLHYLVGKPVDQIAGEVGIPAGTVRSRLARGQRGLAGMSGDPGQLLADVAAGVVATTAPRPAHEIRERGDSRRRHEALRVLAAVLVLAAIGSAVSVLS